MLILNDTGCSERILPALSLATAWYLKSCGAWANNKIAKIKSTHNKKSFNFVKNNLLSCYASLNNNDNYFYCEKEDTEFVKEIKEIELL